MKKQKAFTLAEILIVLTVIGILTAILMPIAIQSAPDENILKFKKANATLGTVIRELVNSDRYYLDGDLGVKADGTLVNDATYFCKTLAEVLNTKSVNCANTEASLNLSHLHAGEAPEGWGNEYVKKLVDDNCKNNTNAGSEIITTDGIVIYQISPAFHFAKNYPGGTKRLFGAPPNTYDTSGFDQIYKPICIDVDGINKGEDPFGYGIRADGKILTGKRADEWIEKSIQSGDE